MLWVLLAVFVVYPLVRLLAMAFTADGSFTLENLRPLVESWYDRQAAVNSILWAVRWASQEPCWVLSLPLP